MNRIMKATASVIMYGICAVVILACFVVGVVWAMGDVL